MKTKFRRIVGVVARTLKAAIAADESSSSATSDRAFLGWRHYLRNSEKWQKCLERASEKPTVLIPTSVGGLSAATVLESLLGVALTLRGANVRFLLCDGILPACLHVHLGKLKDSSVIADYELKKQVCPGCIAKGKTAYETTGLPISYYSEFIEPQEVMEIRKFANDIHMNEIANYRKNDIAIGEHALAGSLRFFACGNLPDTQEAESVLRRYLESALITETVMQNIQAKYSLQAAVFHHGIYVPQGIIGEVARKNGIGVVNWQVAYRKKCFIFSHHETYHHTLIGEPVSTWEDIAWNDDLDQQILSYLKSRWYGSNDWIWFHDQPKHDAAEITKETGIDFSKPTVSLLTNVFWDAQLHFKANAFTDMLDWLLQTITYFSNRPELQLAIRIHPAEVRGAIPSRQPIVREIAKVFPTLPKNVFVIPPESQVSTYVLCENSNSVIIYGTKTGVELTAMGIPVVVAGEAWIRNKGLTSDATSPQSYFNILDTLPVKGRLDAATVERAKRYAFHFFFRRFIPIHFMEPRSSGAPYEICIDSLEDLLPGKDAGLDVICDGILTGSEFVYPGERFLREAS